MNNQESNGKSLKHNYGFTIFISVFLFLRKETGKLK